MGLVQLYVSKKGNYSASTGAVAFVSSQLCDMEGQS